MLFNFPTSTAGWLWLFLQVAWLQVTGQLAVVAQKPRSPRGT